MIIAEIAQSHKGELAEAIRYVDAAADAGAHAVKFQTHLAAEESTLHEPWRIQFSSQDDSRYAYWKRMEFTASEWQQLRQHTKGRGLLFISSPFSEKSVALLEQIGTDVIKVASGEINNPYLFDAICETNVPVLVSSGMSYLAELDTVVAVLRKAQLDFALMQCTSMYPTPAEKVGIQILDQFRERYDCPVGLSDHSGTIFPSLIAAYLGAKAIEVHVAFSRQDTGPDVSSSLTFDELSDMIAGVRFVEALRTSPVDKDAMADELHAMRQLFTKSVVAKTALPKGTVLSSDVLTVKKPGFGIPAARLSTLVGRQTTRALKADTLISEEDLEPTPAEDDAIQ